LHTGKVEGRVQARNTEVCIAGGKNGGIDWGTGRRGLRQVRAVDRAVTRWTDVAAPVKVAVGRVAVEVRRGKHSRGVAGSDSASELEVVETTKVRVGPLRCARQTLRWEAHLP